jgi:hypothetical protein
MMVGQNEKNDSRFPQKTAGFYSTSEAKHTRIRPSSRLSERKKAAGTQSGRPVRLGVERENKLATLQPYYHAHSYFLSMSRSR